MSMQLAYSTMPANWVVQNTLGAQMIQFIIELIALRLSSDLQIVIAENLFLAPLGISPSTLISTFFLK